MKLVIILIYFTTCAGDTNIYHPFSEQFLETINIHKSSWVPRKNFHLDTPLARIGNLVGVFENTDQKLPRRKVVEDGITVPESFDSRINWAGCESIGNVLEQGECSSNWALAAASAMTDRICIHSNGEDRREISAEDILACCDTCGEGCDGGYPDEVWNHWVHFGIVTGGAYGTQKGCIPYSFPPCSASRSRCAALGVSPKCTLKCSNKSFDYEGQRIYGNSSYTISEERDIQLEIMHRGPVEATFIVYEDFLQYGTGVYQHVEGDKAGMHAVKLIGWGNQDEVPHWLGVNSWGAVWGEEGHFKILRGQNHCEIESDVVAGLPMLF